MKFLDARVALVVALTVQASSAQAICERGSPSSLLAVEVVFPAQAAPPRTLTVTSNGWTGSHDAIRAPALEETPATRGIWTRTLDSAIRATSVSLHLALEGFDPAETSGWAQTMKDRRCYAYFLISLQSTGAWSVRVRTFPDDYAFAFVAAQPPALESKGAWSWREPAAESGWQDVAAAVDQRVRVAFFEDDPSGTEDQYLFTSPTLGPDHPSFREQAADVAERVFEDRRDRIRMYLEGKTLAPKVWSWKEGFHRASDAYTRLVSEELWEGLNEGSSGLGLNGEAMKAMKLARLDNAPRARRQAAVDEIRDRLRLEVAEVAAWPQ